MRHHLKYIILLVSLLVFYISGVKSITGSFISCATKPPFSLKKLILVEPPANMLISKEELNDLLSIKNVLNVAGISYKNILIENINKLNLHNYDIIILPFASSKNMPAESILQIKDAISKGACIFFDGSPDIKDMFGMKLNKNLLKVKRIRDKMFYNTLLYWPFSDTIFSLDTTKINFTVISVDDSTNFPLMVSGLLGTGKYIYFPNLFDPYTNKGYTRYPFFIELLDSIFGPITVAERRLVEMYFDPGMNVFPINYDELARKWKRQMIKKIYAAGWYYDNEDIDYSRLIKACHENGILVYCWLEPPMVSKKFWDGNPEWREKTASLRDAHVDWRFLMNLADSSCRKKVFADTKEMLINFDWDGVNLAELYFDPIYDGRENPANFTPMNMTSRNEFKIISGFDPISLFDSASIHYWKLGDSDWRKYISYRKDLCFRLKTKYLDFLMNLNKNKSGFELMLTAIDVSLAPVLSDYIGEDFKNTLTLFEKYPITLQIEDPAACWGLTPERYDKLGQYYSKYITNKNRLVFDCNIVASHEEGSGGFPSEKPTGEEIRQIVYNMSLSGIRPAFYSEDAFFKGDFKNISSTLARETKITEVNDSTWKIITPYQVSVHTGVIKNIIYMDSKIWRAGEDGIIIVPKGEHLFTFKTLKRNNQDIRLNSISGDLESADFTNNTITFTYSEQFTSCYAIVNKSPSSFEIDSVQINCEVFKNYSSTYSVKLPKGRHMVRIKCD
jgi:hypothetical protein